MTYENELDEAVENHKVHPKAWAHQLALTTWLYERNLKNIHEVAMYYGLLDRLPWSAEVKIKCINPEHEDNNPSCSLWREIDGFRCWSCGFKGNLTKFITTMEGNTKWKTIH